MTVTVYYAGDKSPGEVIKCKDFRLQQSVAGMPRLEINVNDKDEALIINWDKVRKIKVIGKILHE